MTVRERVLTDRLIQKIDKNECYARQIGLSYAVTATGACKKPNAQTNKQKTN